MNRFFGYQSNALRSFSIYAEQPATTQTGTGAPVLPAVVDYLTQTTVFIAAVRYMPVADVGLFAVIHASVLGLAVFTSAGWRALIARGRAGEQLKNVAFTLALGRGYAAAVVCVVGGAVVRWFGFDPDASYLFVFLGGAALLTPPTCVLFGLLERRGRAVRLGALLIISDLTAVAVVLGLLHHGMGLAALGAGALVMHLVSFIGGLFMIGGGLRLAAPGRSGRAAVRAARKATTRDMLDYVSGQSVLLIAAAVLGLAPAAYFRVAQMLAATVSIAIYAPLRRLAWSVLLRSADVRRNWSDRTKTNGAGRKEAAAPLSRQMSVFLPLTIVLAAPVMICLAMVADKAVVLLLGEAWAPAGLVTAILALAALVAAPALVTEPLVTAMGESNRIALIALLSAAASLVCGLLSVSFGLTGVAIGQLLAGLVTALGAVWLQNRYVKTPWRGFLAQGAAVYAALAVLIGAIVSIRVLTGGVDLSPAARLSLEIAGGGAAYVVLLLLITPSYLRRALWLD